MKPRFYYKNDKIVIHNSNKLLYGVIINIYITFIIDLKF